ncbi:hypothetical protein FRAAL3115 [Frankia alni ACN14a]|uniref:Uncharacterized protein n=1 Tax=Frankia alni (strain DSM 45986 / CECT 9034 / ACN14a) TaxID=326424 RepID=Q0RL46_FRAAA|nr:hypothetical protein FRAAL3115 [Frankia alni ACN14a]
MSGRSVSSPGPSSMGNADAGREGAAVRRAERPAVVVDEVKPRALALDQRRVIMRASVSRAGRPHVGRPPATTGAR